MSEDDDIAREAREAEERVLYQLGAGQVLDLARDWITLMKLHKRGLVELRPAPNGQLEIVGLTEAGRRGLP